MLDLRGVVRALQKCWWSCLSCCIKDYYGWSIRIWSDGYTVISRHGVKGFSLFYASEQLAQGRSCYWDLLTKRSGGELPPETILVAFATGIVPYNEIIDSVTLGYVRWVIDPTSHLSRSVWIRISSPSTQLATVLNSPKQEV